MEMHKGAHEKTRAGTAPSRNNFQDLWELSPVGYFLLDDRGRVSAVNQVGRQLFGRREGVLFKEHLSTLVAPEDRISIHLLLERVMATGVAEKQEVRIILPDSPIHTCLLEAHLLKGSSGQKRAQVVLTNMTQQKRAEEALRTAKDELELRVQQRTAELVKVNEKLKHEIEDHKRTVKDLHEVKNLLSSIFNAFQDSVFVIDKDFRVKMSNWKDFKSLSEKDHQGHPFCYELLRQRNSPCNPCPVMEVFNTGEIKRIEDRNPINGKVTDVRMFPMFDDEGKVVSVIEHLRDTTGFKESKERIHKLSQQLIEAHENERQMISRELHDRVAQDLSTLKIISETFFDSQHDASPEIKQKVAEFSSLLDRTILAVRDLTYDLRPPGLDDMGLVTGLLMYCEEFAENSPLKVDFQAHGLDRLPLAYDTEINIYRLVQEGLNNIRKHAHASKAVIRLVGSFPNLILRIEDNGKGFDVDERARTAGSEKRMGLRSMTERVNLLRGRMKIQSQLNKGTKIEIKLPCQENSNDEKKNYLDH